MQVRTFEAENMSSGLRQIRRELGPDALILSTKTIKPRGHDSFGRVNTSTVEIIAAVDDGSFVQTPQKSQRSHRELLREEYSARPFQRNSPRRDPMEIKHSSTLRHPSRKKELWEKQAREERKQAFCEVVDDNLYGLLHSDSEPENDRKSEIFKESSRSRRLHSHYPDDFVESSSTSQCRVDKRALKSAESEYNPLHDEVRELRSLVAGLSGQLNRITNGRNTGTQAHSLQISSRSQAESMIDISPVQGDSLLKRLSRCGIQAETARVITGFLRDSYSEEELLDDEILTRKIVETVKNLIEVAPPDLHNIPQGCSGSQSKKQKRIAFVGPTGVGKTTTLAKICAHYISQQRKETSSVAMITIDTYRIAAVEQLKVYGEIMNVPVEVVFSPDQLDQAIARHADKELILIDTAGRSPRDYSHLEELGQFLRPELGIDSHLVLAASTRENELIDTVRQFAKLNVQHTIFTKLDECFTLGVLLNVQLHNPTPLSWLTNGQRVPEDLLHISPETVAELIMLEERGLS